MMMMRKDRGKWHRPLSLTCNLILCIIFLFICMNFTAVIWCSFIFFLLLIGKIIAYTFTGLLLNYDYYLKYQYVYVLAGLAGAYMGSINFYDKYCVLHRNILEQMFVVYEEKKGGHWKVEQRKSMSIHVPWKQILTIRLRLRMTTWLKIKMNIRKRMILMRNENNKSRWQWG